MSRMPDKYVKHGLVDDPVFQTLERLYFQVLQGRKVLKSAEEEFNFPKNMYEYSFEVVEGDE